jgi:hypothetical protein
VRVQSACEPDTIELTDMRGQAAALPQPRRLYAMITACASPATRAQAVLECVRGCCGADHGFLLLGHGERLALVAGSAQRTPPAGLVEAAGRIWHARGGPLAETTMLETAPTLVPGAMAQRREWTSDDGRSFDHRLLALQHGGHSLAIGIAMLATSDEHPLLPIYRMQIEALAKALLDAGDLELDRDGRTPQPA